MATLASRGALTSLLAALDRPGPLVILPHDNPDPDALASAAALKYMFAALARKEAQIGRASWGEPRTAPCSPT